MSSESSLALIASSLNAAIDRLDTDLKAMRRESKEDLVAIQYKLDQSDGCLVKIEQHLGNINGKIIEHTEALDKIKDIRILTKFSEIIRNHKTWVYIILATNLGIVGWVMSVIGFK